MEGVQEGKSNHTSTFQASAYATSITISLFTGSHVAKNKVKGCRSVLLSSDGHGKRASMYDATAGG